MKQPVKNEKDQFLLIAGKVIFDIFMYNKQDCHRLLFKRGKMKISKLLNSVLSLQYFASFTVI